MRVILYGFRDFQAADPRGKPRLKPWIISKKLYRII
jgi:hypothetical protein